MWLRHIVYQTWDLPIWLSKNGIKVRSEKTNIIFYLGTELSTKNVTEITPCGSKNVSRNRSAVVKLLAAPPNTKYCRCLYFFKCNDGYFIDAHPKSGWWEPIFHDLIKKNARTYIFPSICNYHWSCLKLSLGGEGRARPLFCITNTVTIERVAAYQLVGFQTTRSYRKNTTEQERPHREKQTRDSTHTLIS